MRSKRFSNNPETELLRLRNLLDSAGDGFIMHDLQGNIVDANETLCRELGYSLQEILELNVRDIDTESASNLDGMWDSLCHNDSTMVTYSRHKCKNGSYHSVEIKLYAIEYDGTPYISAFIRDVSDRKVTEEKLNLTQFAIEHAADAAFWVDANEHKFIYANIRASEYLGYTNEELLQRGIPDIDSQFTEEGWPTFLERLKECHEMTFESEFVKKDGTHFPVEITANHMKYEDKNYVITFAREISARQKAEKELKRAKDKSDKANQAKSEFLTSMSHELKTPLNAIIGYSEMLATESVPALENEQMHFAKSINQAGHHLLGLIDDVLDLARIEAGKVNLEFDHVNIYEILVHGAAMTKLMAEKKRISLSICESPETDLTAWVDKKKLTQVVLNIISNAIKYNNAGGKVFINLEDTGSHIKVSIKDNGFGINEENKADIFSPFNRLGKENSDIEGTGVGLVICKTLIQLMKGTLDFDSEINKGTCFYFLVPKSK